MADVFGRDLLLVIKSICPEVNAISGPIYEIIVYGTHGTRFVV